MARQELIYYPHVRRPGVYETIDMPQRPSAVWTLHRFRDPNVKPSLPYTPIHQVNAIAEDVSHDWSWRAGQFRYFSRVTDDCIWLLLEFED